MRPTYIAAMIGLSLAACGPGPEKSDAGEPDAGTSDAGEHDAGTDAGTDGGPCTSPTLTCIQQTVFNAMPPLGCNTGACHNTEFAASNAAGLDLSNTAKSYASLVGVTAVTMPPDPTATLLVDPGHPESSFILVKLVGMWQTGATQYGAQMPFAGPELSAESTGLIQDWIAAGAENN